MTLRNKKLEEIRDFIKKDKRGNFDLVGKPTFPKNRMKGHLLFSKRGLIFSKDGCKIFYCFEEYEINGKKIETEYFVAIGDEFGLIGDSYFSVGGRVEYDNEVEGTILLSEIQFEDDEKR